MKNKTMYILSGIQGAGKSTFLKNNNFEKYSLSLDKVRLLFTHPILGEKGDMLINNRQNDMVFNIFINQVLPERLNSGGPIFIDQTNTHVSYIKKLQEIAKKNNYEMKIIDFPLEDMNTYIQRNNTRPEHERVPQQTLEDSFLAKSRLDLSNFEVISQENVIKHFNKSPDDLLTDISNYKEVFFIGDIQGCFSALNTFDNKYKFSDDNFYVFIGDYIDRGLENDKVLKFVEENLNKKNMIFLKGNHEEELKNFYQDKIIGKEFKENTLPQLLNAGFTKERMEKIYNNLEETIYLLFNNTKFIVSHGGYASLPKEPLFLSTDENNYGYGGYEVDVDTLFTNNESNNTWYQIHGHRNTQDHPIIATNKSFNLEGSVEFGEDLRIVSVKKDNKKVVITPISIKNEYFNKKLLKKEDVELIFNEHPKNTLSSIPFNADSNLLSSLRSNPLIIETVSEEFPHISAFNFTKEAFQNSETSFEEELVTHARGLFLNNQNGEFISRGFEKFFNIGEVPQSTIESIEENFKFPLKVYKKENGFFGTIGYDSYTENLVITSKSRTDGEFTDYFKKIANETFSESEWETLKRYARIFNINYIFEINDPINDPHIVEYEKPHLVLLDIVKRQLSFDNVTYESLSQFASKFKNLPVKQKEMTFKDLNSLKGYLNALNSGKKTVLHEGFVCEDMISNKVKIKTPYYIAWKYMRSSNERFLRRMNKFESKGWAEDDKRFIQQKQNTITSIKAKIENNPYFNNELKQEMSKFFDWFLELPREEQMKDIIKLRNKFIYETKIEDKIQKKIKM